MPKSALAGCLALMAVAASSVPATAGGYCDCDYDVDYRYRSHVPATPLYFYEPRVAYYRFGYAGDPRSGYAAVYGPPGYYATLSRGPAVLIRPYPRRHRVWQRW